MELFIFNLSIQRGLVSGYLGVVLVADFLGFVRTFASIPFWRKVGQGGGGGILFLAEVARLDVSHIDFRFSITAFVFFVFFC